MHDLHCVLQNLMQQPFWLIYSTCLLHLSFCIWWHGTTCKHILQNQRACCVRSGHSQHENSMPTSMPPEFCPSSLGNSVSAMFKVCCRSSLFHHWLGPHWSGCGRGWADHSMTLTVLLFFLVSLSIFLILCIPYGFCIRCFFFIGHYCIVLYIRWTIMPHSKKTYPHNK